MNDIETGAPAEAVRTQVARDAARRYLANEHRVLLRTLDPRKVAGIVHIEAWSALGLEQADDDLIQETIDQIKAARVTYTWDGEQPACGAESKDLLAQMGCKPCSLPAGHDQHRYPYPMPARPASPSGTEANDARP
jgi:hypothetical protein